MARFIGSRLRLGFGRCAWVYDIARSRESAAIPRTGFGSARTTTSIRSSGGLSPADNDIAKNNSLIAERSQVVALSKYVSEFGRALAESKT